LWGTDGRQSAQNAFKYSGGSFTNLNSLIGGDSSYATEVSGNGLVIIGGYGTSGSNRAFKYSDSGGFVDLGSLGSGDFMAAYGASYDGSVIVGRSNQTVGGNETAFKYTDGAGMVGLGFLASGNQSSALDVSSDGSVIVGYSNTVASGADYRAFRYTDADGMVDLGTLGGTGSWASAISGDGSVIVGRSQITGDSAFHAFKHVSGSFTDLGTLGGTDSRAYGVSSDGSIIVGRSDDSSGNGRAFKYTDADGMIDLGTLGGDNSAAYTISGDGKVIIGAAQDSSGTYRAFMYNNSVADSSLVDVNNTYSAIYENGRNLNSLLNLKTTLVRSSLNQDCNKFGANGICLGVGYRYSSVDRQYMRQHEANLRIAYRFNRNFRAGLIFDQAFDSYDPDNFTTQNKTPMSGFFLNFSQNKDESGFGARLSALYGKSTADIKRSTLANTEAGMGRAEFRSKGMLAEVSYGKKFSQNLMIKPFAALRKTSVSRGGYKETQGASFPISYNSLEQNFTTAIMGLRSSLKLNEETALTFEFGAENNIRGKVDGYSGNASYLGNFSLNAPNLRTYTNYVDVGIYHDLADNQRISANLYYGTQNLNSAKVAMMYVGYYLGF
jgi:probable HAF family extracellular repeat protein